MPAVRKHPKWCCRTCARTKCKGGTLPCCFVMVECKCPQPCGTDNKWCWKGNLSCNKK